MSPPPPALNLNPPAPPLQPSRTFNNAVITSYLSLIAGLVREIMLTKRLRVFCCLNWRVYCHRRFFKPISHRDVGFPPGVGKHWRQRWQ